MTAASSNTLQGIARSDASQEKAVFHTGLGDANIGLGGDSKINKVILVIPPGQTVSGMFKPMNGTANTPFSFKNTDPADTPEPRLVRLYFIDGEMKVGGVKDAENKRQWSPLNDAPKTLNEDSKGEIYRKPKAESKSGAKDYFVSNLGEDLLKKLQATQASDEAGIGLRSEPLPVSDKEGGQPSETGTDTTDLFETVSSYHTLDSSTNDDQTSTSTGLGELTLSAEPVKTESSEIDDIFNAFIDDSNQILFDSESAKKFKQEILATFKPNEDYILKLEDYIAPNDTSDLVNDLKLYKSTLEPDLINIINSVDATFKDINKAHNTYQNQSQKLNQLKDEINSFNQNWQKSLPPAQAKLDEVIKIFS